MRDALPFPHSDGVDVGALSRLLDDATASYKFLFFRALLDAFKAGGFERRDWSLRELAVGMLAVAWYPSRVCRLSLGAKDGVAAMLSGIDAKGAKPPTTEALDRMLSANGVDVDSLARYVPYRLLSPFFAGRLAAVGDHRRNATIAAAATADFDSIRPLYKFVGDRIELHPAWVAYLAENWDIVSGWAERRWISYLQARNPLAPAVSEKIAPPLARASLAAQTAYWKRALRGMATAGDPATCLFSGAALDPDRLSLDHFLPWTFVCHDALWNLAPVLREVNSAKRDRIPADVYLDRFATLQHRALGIARQDAHAFRWGDVAAEFADGLRIEETVLEDRDALAAAYHRTLGSQMTIARAIGFEGGWTYR